MQSSHLPVQPAAEDLPEQMPASTVSNVGIGRGDRPGTRLLL